MNSELFKEYILTLAVVDCFSLKLQPAIDTHHKECDCIQLQNVKSGRKS